MNTTNQTETGEGNAPRTPDKRTLYKTAKTTIACAAYKQGECVGVKYMYQGTNGTHWFAIGALGIPYPEHHLTDFVL